MRIVGSFFFLIFIFSFRSPLLKNSGNDKTVLIQHELDSADIVRLGIHSVTITKRDFEIENYCHSCAKEYSDHSQTKTITEKKFNNLGQCIFESWTEKSADGYYNARTICSVYDPKGKLISKRTVSTKGNVNALGLKLDPDSTTTREVWTSDYMISDRHEYDGHTNMRHYDSTFVDKKGLPLKGFIYEVNEWGKQEYTSSFDSRGRLLVSRRLEILSYRTTLYKIQNKYFEDGTWTSEEGFYHYPDSTYKELVHSYSYDKHGNLICETEWGYNEYDRCDSTYYDDQNRIILEVGYPGGNRSTCDRKISYQYQNERLITYKDAWCDGDYSEQNSSFTSDENGVAEKIYQTDFYSQNGQPAEKKKFLQGANHYNKDGCMTESKIYNSKDLEVWTTYEYGK
jgi:hypothetical protein